MLVCDIDHLTTEQTRRAWDGDSRLPDQDADFVVRLCNVVECIEFEKERILKGEGGRATGREEGGRERTHKHTHKHTHTYITPRTF